MARQKRSAPLGRVDVQVMILAAVVVVLSCLCVYLYCYDASYHDMLDSMEKRVTALHSAVETSLVTEAFDRINAPADMETDLYRQCHDQMFLAKQAAGVQYLYTAKRDERGRFVYGIDGLATDSSDFRQPGDPIEPEIIPELERAMAGEVVMPEAIKPTDWGKIFIAYLPIHDGPRIVGVLGVEFEAEQHYDTYRAMRVAAPLIMLLACAFSALVAVLQFRRVSNPTYKDLSNTDYLTSLKNRNAFETDMNNLSARKHPGALAVMTMDLNDLKRVNDSLGHDGGDEYLRLAARTIDAVCQSRMAAYRVGGDEFTVLFCQETEVGMAAIKQRLEQTLGAGKPPQWPVAPSFSIGYAVFDPERDADVHETYRRADRAMYMEKQRYHHTGASRA